MLLRLNTVLGMGDIHIEKNIEIFSKSSGRSNVFFPENAAQFFF